MIRRIDFDFLGPWTLLFAGFSIARALGFIFVVVSGRLLSTGDFGLLTYGITIASLTAVLLSSAPIGLARHLVINSGNSEEQGSYFTNWVFAVSLLLFASLCIVPIVGWAAGLDTKMMVAVAANLVGVSTFETYREAQRGVNQYFQMSGFYILANLLQLFAILTFGQLEVRAVWLYLTVYGLSPVAAMLLFYLASPVQLELRYRLLSRKRVIQIIKFVWPLLIQSVCFLIWFGADVLLVRHWLGSVATGGYGAAKTISMGLVLAPHALGTFVLPKAAGLNGANFRRLLVMMLAASAIMIIPAGGLMAIGSRRLVLAIFGMKYLAAVDPLAILVVGMAMHGFYHVMSALWIGRGKPFVDLVCTFWAMVVTVALASFLVPRSGMIGAASAFSAGSGVRLLLITGYTIYSFRNPQEASQPAWPVAFQWIRRDDR